MHETLQAARRKRRVGSRARRDLLGI